MKTKILVLLTLFLLAGKIYSQVDCNTQNGEIALAFGRPVIDSAKVVQKTNFEISFSTEMFRNDGGMVSFSACRMKLRYFLFFSEVNDALNDLPRLFTAPVLPLPATVKSIPITITGNTNSLRGYVEIPRADVNRTRGKIYYRIGRKVIRNTEDPTFTFSPKFYFTINGAAPPPGPARNISPTANAGIDQTITLPENSITLNGTGNDPDGEITRYQWSRVQGTNNVNITWPNDAVTTVSGFTPGQYVFELVVTDNRRSIARDRVTIVVNDAPPPPAGNNQVILTITPYNNFSFSSSGDENIPDQISSDNDCPRPLENFRVTEIDSFGAIIANYGNVPMIGVVTVRFSRGNTILDERLFNNLPVGKVKIINMRRANSTLCTRRGANITTVCKRCNPRDDLPWWDDEDIKIEVIFQGRIVQWTITPRL